MFKKKLSMKQNITISSEDAEFIEFAYKLCNSAKYPSFTKVTEVYNRVYKKQLSSTSCAQCVRQRILELKATLDKINAEILKEDNETITDITHSTENKINNKNNYGGETNENGKKVEEKSEETQSGEEAEQKKPKRGRPSKTNQGSAS